LQVFWKTTFPFRIDCRIAAPECNTPVETPEPQSQLEAGSNGQGDGRVWTVDLGAPLLSLTFQDLVGDDARSERCEILLHWIALDRWSLNALASGIPRVRLPQWYRTNEKPSMEQVLMFWHPADESRAAQMADVLGPAIVSIARQLFSQGKVDEARQWAGPLKWCRDRNALDPLGEEILYNLGTIGPSGECVV